MSGRFAPTTIEAFFDFLRRDTTIPDRERLQDAATLWIGGGTHFPFRGAGQYSHIDKVRAAAVRRLRGEPPESLDADEIAAATLLNALHAQEPTDVDLYRGLNFPSTGHPTSEPPSELVTEGAEFSEALATWTPDRVVADDFAYGSHGALLLGDPLGRGRTHVVLHVKHAAQVPLIPYWESDPADAAQEFVRRTDERITSGHYRVVKVTHDRALGFYEVEVEWLGPAAGDQRLADADVKRARWDPAEHPRVPAGHGRASGRFVSNLDAIADLLRPVDAPSRLGEEPMERPISRGDLVRPRNTLLASNERGSLYRVVGMDEGVGGRRMLHLRRDPAVDVHGRTEVSGAEARVLAEDYRRVTFMNPELEQASRYWQHQVEIRTSDGSVHQGILVGVDGNGGAPTGQVMLQSWNGSGDAMYRESFPLPAGSTITDLGPRLRAVPDRRSEEPNQPTARPAARGDIVTFLDPIDPDGASYVRGRVEVVDPRSETLLVNLLGADNKPIGQSARVHWDAESLVHDDGTPAARPRTEPEIIGPAYFAAHGLLDQPVHIATTQGLHYRGIVVSTNENVVTLRVHDPLADQTADTVVFYEDIASVEPGLHNGDEVEVWAVQTEIDGFTVLRDLQNGVINNYDPTTGMIDVETDMGRTINRGRIVGYGNGGATIQLTDANGAPIPHPVEISFRVRRRGPETETIDADYFAAHDLLDREVTVTFPNGTHTTGQVRGTTLGSFVIRAGYVDEWFSYGDVASVVLTPPRPSSPVPRAAQPPTPSRSSVDRVEPGFFNSRFWWEDLPDGETTVTLNDGTTHTGTLDRVGQRVHLTVEGEDISFAPADVRSVTTSAGNTVEVAQHLSHEELKKRKVPKEVLKEKAHEGDYARFDTMDPDEAATLVQAFEVTSPGGELHTEIRRAYRDGQMYEISGVVLDRHDNRVGTFSRQLDFSEPPTMTNAYFEIDRRHRGFRLADAFYDSSERVMAEQGVEQIRIHADIDVGGYAWARRGFDWDDVPYEVRSGLDSGVDEWLRSEMDDDTRTEIARRWDEMQARVERGETVHPWEIAALGEDLPGTHWTDDSRAGVPIDMWPGKALMLGSDWYGFRTMGDPVPGHKIALSETDYYQALAALYDQADSAFIEGDSWRAEPSDWNLHLPDMLYTTTPIQETKDWDPGKHPRVPRGHGRDSGRFMSPGRLSPFGEGMLPFDVELPENYLTPTEADRRRAISSDITPGMAQTIYEQTQRQVERYLDEGDVEPPNGLDLEDYYPGDEPPQIGEAVARGDWLFFGGARDIRRSADGLLGYAIEDVTTDPGLIYERDPGWGGVNYAAAEPERDALILLHELKETPRRDITLFRGVTDPPPEMIDTLQRGATFDLPLASFADGRRAAERFGSDLVFQLEGPVHSVEGGAMTEWDHEHVSGGRFQVVGIRHERTWAGMTRDSLKDLIHEFQEQGMSNADNYSDEMIDWMWENDEFDWEFNQLVSLANHSRRWGEETVVRIKQIGVFDPDTALLVKDALLGVPRWPWSYLFDTALAEPKPRTKAEKKSAQALASLKKDVGAELDSEINRLADALEKIISSQEETVIARLTGVKARKGTRHWDPPPPETETKALPVEYILNSTKWAQQIGKAARASLRRTLITSMASTARRTKTKRVAMAAAEVAQRLDPFAERLVASLGIRMAKVEEVIALGEGHGEDIGTIATNVRKVYASKKKWAAQASEHATVGVYNVGSLIQAERSEKVAAKAWVSMRDGKVRPTHRVADGQVRLLRDPFLVGGFPMMYPGDPTGPPQETYNCRCVMIFRLESAQGGQVPKPFRSKNPEHPEVPWAMDVAAREIITKAFDPDQPRVPAGHGRESGRWIHLKPGADALRTLWETLLTEVGHPVRRRVHSKVGDRIDPSGDAGSEKYNEALHTIQDLPVGSVMHYIGPDGEPVQTGEGDLYLFEKTNTNEWKPVFGRWDGGLQSDYDMMVLGRTAKARFEITEVGAALPTEMEIQGALHQHPARAAAKAKVAHDIAARLTDVDAEELYRASGGEQDPTDEALVDRLIPGVGDPVVVKAETWRVSDEQRLAVGDTVVSTGSISWLDENAGEPGTYIPAPPNRGTVRNVHDDGTVVVEWAGGRWNSGVSTVGVQTVVRVDPEPVHPQGRVIGYNDSTVYIADDQGRDLGGFSKGDLEFPEGMTGHYVVWLDGGEFQVGPPDEAQSRLDKDPADLPRAGSPEAAQVVREAAVSVLVGRWAQSANDENEWSLALQEAAIEEFMLRDTASWGYRSKWVIHSPNGDRSFDTQADAEDFRADEAVYVLDTPLKEGDKVEVLNFGEHLDVTVTSVHGTVFDYTYQRPETFKPSMVDGEDWEPKEGDYVTLTGELSSGDSADDGRTYRIAAISEWGYGLTVVGQARGNGYLDRTLPKRNLTHVEPDQMSTSNGYSYLDPGPIVKVNGEKPTWHKTNPWSEPEQEIQDVLDASTRHRTEDVLDAHGPTLRRFLRAQYENTQDYLASHGIADLEIYRGQGHAPRLSSNLRAPTGMNGIEVGMRPMSSWTTDYGQASNFGDTTVLTKVDAEDVIGFPGSGVGCLNEQEIVILGNPREVVYSTGGGGANREYLRTLLETGHLERTIYQAFNEDEAQQYVEQRRRDAPEGRSYEVVEAESESGPRWDVVETIDLPKERPTREWFTDVEQAREALARMQARYPNASFTLAEVNGQWRIDRVLRKDWDPARHPRDWRGWFVRVGDWLRGPSNVPPNHGIPVPLPGRQRVRDWLNQPGHGSVVAEPRTRTLPDVSLITVGSKRRYRSIPGRGRLSEDGGIFLRPAGRMSDGRTAYEIWHRVDPKDVAFDEEDVRRGPNGEVIARRPSMEGWYSGQSGAGEARLGSALFGSVADPWRAMGETDSAWYAHTYDAGGLDDAKYTAEEIIFNGEVHGTVPLTDLPEKAEPGSWSRGAWAEVSVEEFQAQRVRETYDRLMRLSESMKMGLSHERAMFLAQEEASELAVPRRVVRNGSIMIEDYSSGEVDLGAIGALVDRLQQSAPKDKMEIMIDGPELKAYPGHVDGLSHTGDSLISLRARSMRMTYPLTAYQGAEPPGMHMPSVKERSWAEYTLVHEWGHAIDQGREVDFESKLEDATNVSAYAMENRNEFYAEMFTEWMLTGGHPKRLDGEPNTMIAALAKKEGWPFT